MRTILIEIGVPSGEAAKWTFYSLRRFMPTMAAAVRLDPTSAAAVGNWQSSSTGSSSSTSVRFQMAAHYAGEKMAQAMRAKYWILGALHGALLQSDLGSSTQSGVGNLISNGHMVPAGAFTWKDVYKHSAEFSSSIALEEAADQLYASARGSASTGSSTSPLKKKGTEEVVPDDVPTPVVDSDEDVPDVCIESEKEELSASDSGSESDEETGAARYSVAAGNWFVQSTASKKKVAHLARFIADKKWIPLCSKGEPFDKPHKRSGEGIPALLAEFDICTKCFNKLCPADQEEVLELMGDS